MKSACMVLLILCLCLLPACSLSRAESKICNAIGEEQEKRKYDTRTINNIELAEKLLATCTVDSTDTYGTLDYWDSQMRLKQSSWRVEYKRAKMLRVNGGEELPVEELLIPIPNDGPPDHIFVRCGDTIRSYARYNFSVLADFICNGLFWVRPTWIECGGIGGRVI